MNAMEQLSVEEPLTCECSSPLTRKYWRDIPAQVTSAGTVTWTTEAKGASTGPIPLEHYFDKVTWDMSALGMPKGTVYEIKFKLGPGSFDPKLGPFKTVNQIGDKLIGDQSIHDQGCYIYDLYATPPTTNQCQPIAIDPQIDNVAPPPPPTTGEPPEDPQDWRRAEH